MRLSIIASFACTALSANAFQYPNFVPLHRRQQPGTPEYDCHANCGGVITASRTDDYCDSTEFESQLSACLDCALEYDIWKYYGNSVSGAATACGLDSTPVDQTSTSTTEAETSVTVTPTTSIPGPEETEPVQSEITPVPVPSSSGSISLTSSSEIVASQTPSRPVNSGTSTPSPSPIVFDGSASSRPRGGIFFSVIVGSLVAAMI